MIVVLASGSGSNFEALATRFPGAVTGLVCNVEGAPVLDRARALGVPQAVVPSAATPDRPLFDEKVAAAIHGFSPPAAPVRLVVLAGYMRILSERFFERMDMLLPGVPLINLHPAHPRDYKGARAYEHAVANGFTRWGLCVHHVTPALDSGPVIRSCEVDVHPGETASELRARLKPVEHALLTDTVAGLLGLRPLAQDHTPNSSEGTQTC